MERDFYHPKSFATFEKRASGPGKPFECKITSSEKISFREYRHFAVTLTEDFPVSVPPRKLTSTRETSNNFIQLAS